ncbi:hypothetical protein J6590_099020, partial [Homalodisca vitripennis]
MYIGVPYERQYMRPLVIPQPFLYSDMRSTYRLSDAGDHLQKLTRLNEVFKEIKERMKRAHEINAQRYNLRRREQQFKAGQLVWKRNFTQADAVNYKSSKLFPKF